MLFRSVVTENGTFAAAGAASNVTNYMKTLSTSAVDTLNTALNGAKVSVDITGSGVTWDDVNNIDHGIQYTTPAVAQKNGGLLGGEVELTASMVTGGAALTIDDKTFNFQVKSSGTTSSFGLKATASGYNVVIDSRKFTTASAQLAEAKRLMTTGSTTNFDINTAAGNKISIDQKVTASGAGKGSFTKMADVTVKVSTAAVAAKNAGTKLAIDPANIKAGNVLKCALPISMASLVKVPTLRLSPLLPLTIPLPRLQLRLQLRVLTWNPLLVPVAMLARPS